MIVDFALDVADKGYRLTDDQRQIVPLGDSTRSYRPLERPGGQSLYERFANVETPEQLLNFVRLYGPLEGGATDVERSLEWANLFAEALRYKLQKNMPMLFGALDQTNDDPLFVQISTEIERGKGMQLKIRPMSLLDALRLQLAQAAAGASEIRLCAYCGSLFVTGGRGNPKRGAKFCCYEHQRRANNEKRPTGGTRESDAP